MNNQLLSHSTPSAQANHAFLSADVLLLIFEEFASYTMHLPWPQAQYDIQRARAPFVLATTCKLWRHLALSIPSLWSYLGFPVLHQPITQLELRVARSRETPVDIFFQPHSCSPDSDGARCLAVLHALAPRWRQVHIHYPSAKHPTDISFTCLTACAMPHLQSLSLTSEMAGRDGSQALVGVLPDAPSLRRVMIDDLAINWTLYAQPVCALTNLTISMYTWPTNALYALLTKVAGTLTSLAIYGLHKRPRSANGGAVPLLKLSQLTLHGVRWLEHIYAPNLRRLELATSHIMTDITPLLIQFAGIQTLVLWGDLRVANLGFLHTSAFAGLTHLKIAVPPGYYEIFGRGLRIFSGDCCHVPTLFLNRLVGTTLEPPIWPLLQQVSFGDDADPLPQRIEVEPESVVALARRGVVLENEETVVRLQVHIAPAVTSRDAIERLLLEP